MFVKRVVATYDGLLLVTETTRSITYNFIKLTDSQHQCVPATTY